MKIYKTKGLEYYARDCRSSCHAAVIFLKNKIGVTPDDLEECEESSIPNDAVVFYSEY